MAEAAKIIVTLIIISVMLAILPSIFSGNLSVLGFGSVTNTLVQPTVSKAGLISISYDGGATFKDAKVFSPGTPNVITLNSRGGVEGAPFSRDKIFYAGTDAGLYLSQDGGLSWYPYADLEKNIDSKTTIYDFAFQPRDNTIFVSAFKNNHGVIYKTADNFFTVTAIWEEQNMPVLALGIDSRNLTMGLSDGRLLSYDLEKQTIEKLRDFDTAIRGINITDNGKNIFVLLSNGQMWTSTNSGLAWEASSNFSGLAFFSGSSKNLSLKTDKDNPAVLYLASTAGIFRSINEGSSWNSLNTILPAGANVASLAAEKGNIYATADAKLYESKDGGETWRVTEPLPTNRGLSSLYVANGGELVIVGTRK